MVPSFFFKSSCSCTPFLKLVQRQLGGSLRGYNQKQMEGREANREREGEKGVSNRRQQ